MRTVSPDTRADELVGRYPSTRDVFDRFGIDLDGEGEESLRMLCHAYEVHLTDLLRDLAVAIDEEAGIAAEPTLDGEGELEDDPLD